jgi:hypothetical protein
VLAPSAAAGGLNSDDNPPPKSGSAGHGNATGSPSAPTTGPNGLPASSASSAAAAARSAENSSGSSFPIGYVVLGSLVLILAIALYITRFRPTRSEQ